MILGMYGDRQVSSARAAARPSSRAASAALVTNREETCRAPAMPLLGVSRAERRDSARAVRRSLPRPLAGPAPRRRGRVHPCLVRPAPPCEEAQTPSVPVRLAVISGQDFSVLPVVNPGSPLFSLTAGKAVRYRGAEPQEDPMRRTLPLCLLVVSCLLSVAEAGQANRCRRACRAAVDDCVATTHRRRACKKQLIRACRQHGGAACDITPPTTTTTTFPALPTTSSTSTTTTTTSVTTTLPVRDYSGAWIFVGTLEIGRASCRERV